MSNKLQQHSTTWQLLPNGNVLHRCGLELESDGSSWQMTPASGVDFAIFTRMERGLSAQEAKELADLLILQGATWATSGLH
ncbi:hypothetical protein EKL30_12820 [Candidimonas sp. SYP-B2681]|uniref:hypothetical protein n=1 Tax=Candidimonas sp. SYP-B2681 TaxID=2497686 RepID=UPI000F88002B|nr:hypothetical protein [Candidimonas sp. SYP-B2681]RTZ42572.1 hypothetical protein EKL30_12820 [Candidimonas sp. SYP-B2681]